MSLNKVSHKINQWITANYASRRSVLQTYLYRACTFLVKTTGIVRLTGDQLKDWCLYVRVIFAAVPMQKPLLR